MCPEVTRELDSGSPSRVAVWAGGGGGGQAETRREVRSNKTKGERFVGLSFCVRVLQGFDVVFLVALNCMI